MKDETRRFLDKAERGIQAAEILLKSGSVDFAAGRAYYGMFYVAEALLYDKDIRVRKHSGVHAAFGKHFANTGAFDSKYHRWLLDAFDKRIQGNHGVEVLVTSDDIQTMVEQAREFLQTAIKFLDTKS